MLKIKVNAYMLNVRKNPNILSEIVRIVERNEILEASEIENGWVKIKDGYVMAEFVNVLEEIKEPEQTEKPKKKKKKSS